jgi:hypothetical protein
VQRDTNCGENDGPSANAAHNQSFPRRSAPQQQVVVRGEYLWGEIESGDVEKIAAGLFLRKCISMCEEVDRMMNRS